MKGSNQEYIKGTHKHTQMRKGIIRCITYLHKHITAAFLLTWMFHNRLLKGASQMQKVTKKIDWIGWFTKLSWILSIISKYVSMCLLLVYHFHHYFVLSVMKFSQSRPLSRHKKLLQERNLFSVELLLCLLSAPPKSVS